VYGAVVGTGPAVRWHHSRQLLVNQPSTMNGQLPPAREECVAGEPSFGCERAGDREEALDALEGLFALVPDELLAAYGTRIPPAPRDLGDVVRRVLAAHEFEAGEVQESLVLLAEREDEEPDRGSGRDLLVGDQAVDDDWIGEHGEPPWPQDSAPLPKHVQPTG